MAQLLLINGAPGVGKTTLLRRLSQELDLPGLGKDDIKEFLFDALGYSDRDWSRILGRASSEALYVIASEFLSAGQSVIIENAFWPEFAAPAIERLCKQHDAVMLEVYCETDDETRMQRFRDRSEGGERHPGHVDNLATLVDRTDTSHYGPLMAEPAIRYDTTAPSEADFQNLLQAVRARLQ